MKNKYSFLLTTWLLVQLFVTGCITDNGNYTYQEELEMLPVVIEPLADLYQVYQGDSLRITPSFKKMDDENRYEYKWYVLNNDNNEVTVLGTEMRLNDVVGLSQKEYDLYFEVKDPNLDVFIRTTSKLSVASNIQNGWYILKEVDGMTDFDYEGIDKLRVHDVMKEVVGDEQLKGKPVRIVYHRDSYYTEGVDDKGKPVILRNQKAIHVLSDTEFKTVDAAKIKLFKQYDDQFYIKPEMTKPMFLNFQGSELFYIDAGGLYTLGVGGVGKFASKKYIGNFDFDYSLFPSMLSAKRMSMVFDTKRRSFLLASHDAPRLSLFANLSGQPSLNNMDADLVTIIQQTSQDNTSVKGYAIMKSRSNSNEHKLLYMELSTSNENPAMHERVIPSKSYLPFAKAYGGHPTNTIFFSKGNELWAYNSSSDDTGTERDMKLKTFPADEEVAFIKYESAYLPGGEKRTYHLVVATNNTQGWKVYFFGMEGQTAVIKPDPEYIITGEGKVKEVMYYSSVR